MRKDTRSAFQELLNLSSTKEYVNCAIAVRRYLRDEILTDAQYCCWDLLYELGRFSGGILDVSQYIIAKRLRKSVSTVSRLLGALKAKGLISFSYAGNGAHNSCNQIHLSFPSDVLLRIQQEEPDRAQVKIARIKRCGTAVPQGLQKTHSHRQAPLSVANVGFEFCKNEIPTFNYNTKSNNNRDDFFDNQDKVVSLPVVDLSQIEKRKAHIFALKEKLKPLNFKFCNAALKDKYVLTRQISELEGHITVEAAKLDRLETQAKQRFNDDKFNQTLKDDTALFNQIKGQRQLNQFQHKRLINRLNQLVNKNVVGVFANEITHNVRFGSLSANSYLSGTELSTDHAINIALKLVQERRYEPVSAVVLQTKLLS